MEEKEMRFTKETARTPYDCGEGKSLEMLVDAFAEAMKAKLRKKILEGYKGWDDPKWTREKIVEALKAHLEKGDPVDIANFAAFIWNRE